MTLVLASRCIDGVVVVADTKITDLETLETLRHDEKLKGVIHNVIFGYSGAEDSYQIFERYAIGDLVILRDSPEPYTYQNMIQKFCEVTNLMRKFRGNVFRLDVMVARQFPTGGPSDLFLIKSTGTYQQISEWKTVGTGEPKADKMVSEFWKKDIKMKDFAELGYCIIKYI
jgi:20S proteasome alpha/beta subunit